MMKAKKPIIAKVTAAMAAIRAAPKDRMNWMTSCTFALTRAHSYWARFARFMVTVWLRSVRSRVAERLRELIPMILVLGVAYLLRLQARPDSAVTSVPQNRFKPINSISNNANAGSRSRRGST